MMNSVVKKLFFNGAKVQTFSIIRLAQDEVQEKVYLKQGKFITDVSRHQGMICLEPFCVAVWLPNEQFAAFEPNKASLLFKKGKALNAKVSVSLNEKIATGNGALLLYKVEDVSNYQLGPLHRLALFGYFLRAKTNTFYSRRVISALYSYPRRIIIVSYKEDGYCNIFPMDIQAYIPEEEIYILGLRTVNITLDKILSSGKVVVCDTDKIDIATVYSLGKHPSMAPTPLEEMPFSTTPSPTFGFPIPDFTASFKEIEILQHKKMGYHMLMVGKVINKQQIRENAAPLWHVGFLQYQMGNYKSIEGLY